MARRLSRISHGEVRRMVKAVESCALSVGKIVFDGTSISVVISGDSGETSAPRVDAMIEPENCSSLDEYRAWRDKQREGGQATPS